MNKMITALVLTSLTLSYSIFALESPTVRKIPSASQTNEKPTEENQEGIVLFSPPPGWRFAEANALPAHVRVMVVGEGPSAFPPSMNLSSEPYKGSLKQYLKTVKNLNAAQGYEWKDLGNIKTDAGNASLSQVDTKTQWGDVRLMHVILLKNERVYILTASALKDEFSLFYKDFFTSMRSLKVAKDIDDMVTDPQERNRLKAATTKLMTEWEALIDQKQKAETETAGKELREATFKSREFQEPYWKPFQEMLKQKYDNLGPEWHEAFLKKIEGKLLDPKNNKRG